MSERLMNFEKDVNYHAPILLTHLTGATDAGSAGGMAIEQLLSSLPAKRVATFDTDRLIDYRANRPKVTIENWAVTEVEVPQIALDLVQDDAGTPILVLHGPEPDAKWQRFAHEIQQFARDAGVEIVVSLTGMPAAVPHTRPTLVHMQSTDAELVEGQPQLQNTQLQFPASADTFLHHSLSKEDIADVRFLAAVPYYMANIEFPRASLALLERMAGVLDLNLPMGNIEAGTQYVDDQLEAIASENEEILGLVGLLEKHYDEEIMEATKAISDEASTETPTLGFEDSEQMLKNLHIDADKLAHTIEQFLARTESANSPEFRPVESDDGRPRPRHRAPKPWEAQFQNKSEKDGSDE